MYYLFINNYLLQIVYCKRIFYYKNLFPLLSSSEVKVKVNIKKWLGFQIKFHAYFFPVLFSVTIV